VKTVLKALERVDQAEHPFQCCNTPYLLIVFYLPEFRRKVTCIININISDYGDFLFYVVSFTLTRYRAEQLQDKRESSLKTSSMIQQLQKEPEADLKTSQVRTVWSQEAEASMGCEGEKLRATTGPSCAASTSNRRLVFSCHTYIW
jgi:hypothetical protein